MFLEEFNELFREKLIIIPCSRVSTFFFTKKNTCQLPGIACGISEQNTKYYGDISLIILVDINRELTEATFGVFSL